MTLMRLYYLVRKLYRLMVALAALSGIGPGALPKVPGVVPPPAVVAPAPPSAPAAPAPPAKKVIGGCATGDIYQGAKRVGFNAVCVVDGASYTLPSGPTGFPTRAAAQQAIRDFRTANA